MGFSIGFLVSDMMQTLYDIVEEPHTCKLRVGVEVVGASKKVFGLFCVLTCSRKPSDHETRDWESRATVVDETWRMMGNRPADISHPYVANFVCSYRG